MYGHVKLPMKCSFSLSVPLLFYTGLYEKTRLFFLLYGTAIGKTNLNFLFKKKQLYFIFKSNMSLIHVNRVFMFSIIWLSVDSFVHRKCFVTIQKISFKEFLLRQIPNATILFLSFSFFNLKKTPLFL